MTLQEKIAKLQNLLSSEGRRLDDEIEGLQDSSDRIEEACNIDPTELEALAMKLDRLRDEPFWDKKIHPLLEEAYAELVKVTTARKLRINGNTIDIEWNGETVWTLICLDEADTAVQAARISITEMPYKRLCVRYGDKSDFILRGAEDYTVLDRNLTDQQVVP